MNFGMIEFRRWWLMRRFANFSIAAFLAAAIYGQTVVEHSVATAGASAAAAGANGAGKAIGGVFRNLGEILDKAGKVDHAEKTSVVVPKTIVSAPPKDAPPREPARLVPPSKLADPSEITDGISRAELIERFGGPMLSLFDTTGETMWYRSSSSGEIEIKLIGGKVASIYSPPGSKPEAKK